MKAVVCRDFAGYGSASIEERPSPRLEEGCVRIAVRASCASFASLLVMKGQHQNRVEPPFTPGTEVAGIVLESAPGTTLFRAGDRVIAAVKSGGYADEVVVPEETVFALPAGVGFEVGATLPSVYGTAYAGLAWRARLQAGETALVLGAAGGSGIAAIELAKAMGARVIACASSPSKLAVAREHGADETVDYRTETLRDRVLALTNGRGADVAFDPVGGELAMQTLRCMAPEGRLVSTGFASGDIPQIPANILLVKDLTAIGLYWGYYLNWGRVSPPPGTNARVRQAFDQIFQWILDGRLRPRVSNCFPLEEFQAALRLIESREVVGRVVLLPRS